MVLLLLDNTMAKHNQKGGAAKVFRPKKAINKQNKIELKFDPNARREFLNGFHKRKMARQKRAQEELAAEMKAEKKRIKEEARNLHKTFVVSHRPIPEVEELLGKEENFDFEQHSVSIKELSTASLADENFWIGENRTTYDDPDEEEGDAEGEKKKEGPKTGKEVKKAVKKMATKQVQKSKAFQKKGKLEQKKQKKKSRVDKRTKKVGKSAKSGHAIQKHKGKKKK